MLCMVCIIIKPVCSDLSSFWLVLFWIPNPTAFTSPWQLCKYICTIIEMLLLLNNDTCYGHESWFNIHSRLPFIEHIWQGLSYNIMCFKHTLVLVSSLKGHKHIVEVALRSLTYNWRTAYPHVMNLVGTFLSTVRVQIWGYMVLVCRCIYTFF